MNRKETFQTDKEDGYQRKPKEINQPETKTNSPPRLKMHPYLQRYMMMPRQITRDNNLRRR